MEAGDMTLIEELKTDAMGRERTWQGKLELRTAERIERLSERVKELESNPQVGTCIICGSALWRNEPRMSDVMVGVGEFHPMCKLTRRIRELEQELVRLRDCVGDQDVECIDAVLAKTLPQLSDPSPISSEATSPTPPG